MKANLHIILHIEDDPNDRFFVQAASERGGLKWRIQAVRNGEEAMAYLQGGGVYSDRERHPMPDLILLDLKLPKTSGFDFLNWFRNEPARQGIPVVVISGADFEHDIERAAEMGAAGCYAKPLEVTALVPILKEIHTKWLAAS